MLRFYIPLDTKVRHFARSYQPITYHDAKQMKPDTTEETYMHH